MIITHPSLLIIDENTVPFLGGLLGTYKDVPFASLLHR
jgi:hypothetical protein